MRRLWAQLAAIGVRRIMLTNAERVERAYFDTHVIAPACYRPLLLEGLQQARDTRVPAVSVHRRFRPFVEDDLDGLVGEARRVVADPSASRPIRSVVADVPDSGRVVLAVGPEGGWNAFELALLEKHGFQSAGMGPRTLRTDTACIALLALLHDVLERRSG
jgi:RsmE family RNA methyltransferase